MEPGWQAQQVTNFTDYSHGKLVDIVKWRNGGPRSPKFRRPWG